MPLTKLSKTLVKLGVASAADVDETMVLVLKNGVECGGGGKQMRVKRALIVGGAIAFVSVIFSLGTRAEAQTSPVATGGQGASSKAAVAVGTDVKDKNFDLGNVSKALVDEASRLSNDAAGWGRKLQELELEFNKNQQDDETIAKNVDETLIVLRAAASRLAPDAEARVTLRKEEGALRELASRAEVHSHPEIRKSAGYFQQKTTELHALNRSVEETRIQLISQIDRLEELKAELEFRGAGQIGDSVMRGQATLSSIQVIAANAQRLASDLDGFGRTPSAEAKPADVTNSVQATKSPAAATKPADATNPAPATKRR
jgi:hypothetical protein